MTPIKTPLHARPKFVKNIFELQKSISIVDIDFVVNC